MLRRATALLVAVALSACTTTNTDTTAAPTAAPAAPGAPTTALAPSTTATTLTTVATAVSVDPPTPSTEAPGVDRVPAVGTVSLGSVPTPDGRRRTYRLYRPASHPSDRAAPLVVALHGGTGWGAQFAANSGFDEVAEAHGVVVAYPDGVGIGPDEGTLRTWNAGYCCGPAANTNVDDVTFVRQLIDDISSQVSIDPDRVYVLGHSNGGMLAYRLACELSDRIAAIALQAGSLGVEDCSPTAPVSVLHLHGTDDENHPIDGGDGPRSISGVSYRSAMSSVSELAQAIGCDDGATETTQRRSTRTTWSSCPDGAEVELVAVTGAVHAWMGGDERAGGPDQLTNPPNLDVDASVVAWEFVSRHRRSD